MNWLRVQTPTLRLQLATDADVDALGDLAARLRAEHDFPDDWVERPLEYDCAVSTEPVHPDYWRCLAETLHELRLCRGERDRLAGQLDDARARLAALATNPDPV